MKERGREGKEGREREEGGETGDAPKQIVSWSVAFCEFLGVEVLKKCHVFDFLKSKQNILMQIKGSSYFCLIGRR